MLEKLIAFRDIYLSALRDESAVEGGLAFSEKLVPEWFDYSLDSLYYVDGYLFSLYALKEQIDEQQLQNSVWAIGFYVGEVILKNSVVKRGWQHYEDFFPSHSEKFQNHFPLTMGNLAVLAAEEGNFTLPVSKVIRFIEEGPENSIQLYASQEVAGQVPS